MDQELRKLSRDKTGELFFCGWLSFPPLFFNWRLANLSYNSFLCYVLHIVICRLSASTRRVWEEGVLRARW